MAASMVRNTIMNQKNIRVEVNMIGRQLDGWNDSIPQDLFQLFFGDACFIVLLM